ncbi:UNVERIFIED_CONTAM: Enzymatic polyprotein [Sesamum radiatum]|uniref:Enzymatic polyprotein n=1 Tax=Sesamum radiatum TaxID=300843 RepID=A0AAW2NQ31_SESRA
MDLQPNQSNYNEGDRLQTSESLSGFFSRMTVSNKTMERIMRQDSNLSPYDGFRLGESLIPKEEILEELSKLREEVAVTMKWIHIGAIEVVIKATFKEGIDSEIHLSIMDRRINNLRDGCLGTMIGNLYAGKLMFDIHPRIAYNLADQDFSRVLTLHQDFKRKDLMKEGNRPYSITYRIAYALSNTHHSDLFLRKEYIEIPRIFKEFAKVMTPDPIKIPRIGGVDLIIKDHPVLERTLSTRTEFSSRMSFSEDRIMGYRGKERELIKTFTPQEIRQPVIGRYEGMLEIAGHEILVAGVAGKENGSMTLGLNFLEDHKPWGRKAYIDSGSGICTAKPGVFPKEAIETLPVIAGRDFSQKILILNKGIREAKIMIGGAFGSPWFRGLIESDSFYEESEKEIINLKEALQEIKSLDISEESKLSLENVKRLIQRNFSENPLAWWDRNKIEATLKVKEECKYEYVRYKPIQMNMEDKRDMQMIIKEHINLGLIEPGVSAYSSPGFLVRNHGEIKRGKPRLVINYQGINKILEFDGYYIPSREHLIDCIKGAKVFSKFDCKSGFYQIKMENESKKFTAFSTPQGQYIWNVLPMGLANAPQIFQRKMDNLFKDYFEFMFVYIDDILIASKNMKDHIKHLEIFSDACHKEGLVLSEKKATIAVNKIEFLGILIDETGIELQEHIVEKIRNFPDVLKDKKHFTELLGSFNFAGIFIKDLAKYRKDFRPLLKETESSKWKWGEIHTQRVRELKQVCSNLPKLAIPQDEDELVVYTDANDYRWAAVLMKKTTTGEEPCRYTGGFSQNNKPKCGISTRKNSLQFGRPLRNGPYFYLLKNLH